MSAVSVIGAAVRDSHRTAPATRAAGRRPSIVLEVGSSVVTARVVSGNVVLWESEIGSQSSVDRAASEVELLREAVRHLPRRILPFARRRCRVVLHEPLVRVKPLAGLPSPCDPLLLQRIVEQGVERFFIGATPTTRRVAIQTEADGVVWAAAYDSSVLSEITAACDAAGVRLERVEPLDPTSVADAADRGAKGYNPSLALTGLRSARGRASASRLASLALAAGLVALGASAVVPPLRHQRLAARASAELRTLAPEVAGASRQLDELRQLNAQLGSASSKAATSPSRPPRRP